MPSKSTPFTPSSILFRPRDQRTDDGRQMTDNELVSSVVCPRKWWRRRVLPPGPMGLLRWPFIAIAGLRRLLEYRCKAIAGKVRGEAEGSEAIRSAVRLRTRTTSLL